MSSKSHSSSDSQIPHSAVSLLSIPPFSHITESRGTRTAYSLKPLLGVSGDVSNSFIERNTCPRAHPSVSLQSLWIGYLRHARHDDKLTMLRLSHWSGSPRDSCITPLMIPLTPPGPLLSVPKFTSPASPCTSVWYFQLPWILKIISTGLSHGHQN